MDSLEKCFKNVENPTEEKASVVLGNSITVDELINIFKIKDGKILGVVDKDGHIEWNEKKFMEKCEVLQSYTVERKILNEFISYTRKNIDFSSRTNLLGVGAIISVLVQILYDKGENYFKFGDVIANGFCSFLKGKEKNKIWIHVDKLYGEGCLFGAQNVIFDVDALYGNDHANMIKNCIITVDVFSGESFCNVNFNSYYCIKRKLKSFKN